MTTESAPASAFERLQGAAFRATALTRGPWHPEHQHAGPPIALGVSAGSKGCRSRNQTAEGPVKKEPCARRLSIRS